MARTTYFCVDIECSGPVPGLYDMISLGAVPVVRDLQSASSTPVYRVVDASFYVEIRPTGPRVEPGAMKVNGLDLDALRAHGVHLPDALRDLTAFVRGNLLPGTRAVFVGHNAPFDWSFVNHAYHVADQPNPFGYKALDTKAFASGVLGLHWFDADKETLAERLPLPVVEQARVHRADYDAWYQAHILARLLEAGGIED